MTKNVRSLGIARRQAPHTELATGVLPEELTRRQVTARFRALLAGGARIRPAGRARRDPELLLTRRYLPYHALRLFDATYYLSDYGFDDALGFFVAYVVLQGPGAAPVRTLYPRLIYKDSSLMWRVASHFVHDHEEYWIGKGDVRWHRENGHEVQASAEETTNLPFEIQHALSVISRRTKRRRDDDAVELVLREGPSGRIAPYADFSAPRRKAAEQYSINGGRKIARFRRRGDPGSLVFARGYEPDLAKGLLEEHGAVSKFFGGTLRVFRMLSVNRRIQYQFFASPTHVWLQPPQTLTTELSTYGVRTLDVHADDDLFLPGYEYHEDGSSQIPVGYAGAPHPKDPHRADASAWLEALPIVRSFRRVVLGERG